MAGTTSSPPSATHLAYREALIHAIRAHSAALQAHDLLAINAHIVGRLMASLDERVMTLDQAMRIVIKNIEQGHADALSELMGPHGGTA